MFAQFVLFDLSIATTPGQSGLWSNGNNGELHIPQICKTETWSSDSLSYLGHSLGALSPCRDADVIFYSPSQLDCITPGPTAPGSNGYLAALCTPRISRTGYSPSDVVLCHIEDTNFLRVLGVLLYCGEYS